MASEQQERKETLMNNQTDESEKNFMVLPNRPQWLGFGGIVRFAWLPIPLLLTAIIMARVTGLNEIYRQETLTLVLSFFFYTLVSLGTLFLVGRSFLALGTPGLLLLECGVILWSLSGTVGDAVSHGDPNINVTIFNTGIMLAGLCHLAGAILSLRPQQVFRAKPLWLGAGCALALGALGMVTWAALANWLPVFFVPGQGGTLVRYCVLISAITMFGLSAGLLLTGKRVTRSPFTSWYALALLLLAVGLFGVMIQLSLGCVVNWLGRAAQWLGGIYLLLAAIAALSESQLPLLPPEKESRPEIYGYGVAIAIVLASAAGRLVFLPGLGTRVTFLTCYPAVILAALYGGLRAGLLTTVLSAIIANYFWVEPVGQFTLRSSSDWVSLIVFLLSGSLITWVSETMHRARKRASEAETRALLAAERQAAAEVLQKSEERYHTLFTGMTEGFSIHELLLDKSGKPVDYRFLDVNPAFERLTGLKRQDVVGKTCNEVLPGEDPKWLQKYGQVALTGQPVQFENYAPTLERYYEVFAYRPAPMQFAVIFMDITERKQAEEQLSQSQKTFSELVERAPFGIYVVDSQFRIAQMNAGSQNGTFRNVRPVIGRNFSDAMRILWPETVASEIIAVFRHTLETGEPYYSPPFINARHDVGTIESYEWEAHRMTLPDGQYGVICYYFDSTKLRRAEEERDRLLHTVQSEKERILALVSSIQDEVWFADIDKNVSLVNPAVLKEFGLNALDGKKAEKIAEGFKVFRPDGTIRPIEEAPPLRALGGEVVKGQEEIVLIPTRGELRHRQVNAAPVRDDSGRIVGSVSVVRDITEQKRMEQDLRRSRDELEVRVQERTEELSMTVARLENLNLELEEFTFVASHDLQEPLRKIETFAGLVKKRCASNLDQTSRDHLDRVLRSANRMRQLLHELLKLSRLTTRKEPLKIIDLGQIAEEAADVFEALLKDTGGRITIEDLPMIEADESQIRQLFQNLIGNALKFRDDQIPVVRIHGRVIDQGLCEIVVKDNGIGFEPEFTEIIFKPFERLHGLSTYEGTGMGLAICRKIVERHGGTIHAESEPGKGATFIIRLPIRQTSKI
jgi:PAS domain S-box-containing protein